MIDGLPVHYEVMGQGEPVVFIHGLSGSSRWWCKNIPTIARHYRVYLVDLPGFGMTRHLHHTFSLKQCATWVNDWMQAIGLDEANLVGHSMGGYVSMALAALHPEKVKRLILVASIGIPFGCSVNRMLLPMVKAIGRTNPAFWPYLAYDYFRAGPAMVHRASSEIVALDATEVISAVQTPTLLIWGEYDDLVLLEFGRRLREQIMGSRLLILSNANHICMFDQPHDFNLAVLTFLQGQEIGV